VPANSWQSGSVPTRPTWCWSTKTPVASVVLLPNKVDVKVGGTAQLSAVALDGSGNEVARYNLFECWPTKWIGPSLNAKNSGHATESLEVVFERFELK